MTFPLAAHAEIIRCFFLLRAVRPGFHVLRKCQMLFGVQRLTLLPTALVVVLLFVFVPLSPTRLRRCCFRRWSRVLLLQSCVRRMCSCLSSC